MDAGGLRRNDHGLADHAAPRRLVRWRDRPAAAGGGARRGTAAVSSGPQRVLRWKAAQRDMDWGGVILIVAGLSLGVMVFDTGAARWLAQVLLGRLPDVPGLLQPFVIVLVGGGAAHGFLQQYGDRRNHHADPDRARAGLPPRHLDHRGSRGVHLDARPSFSSPRARPTSCRTPPATSTIRDMAKVGIAMTVAAAACVTVAIAVVQLLGL